MDFRIIKEATLPQVKKLWDYCFEKEDSFFFQWYFSQYCPQHNQVLGGFDADQNLLTMLHLNPYTLQFKGQTVKTKYIVGVATDPVARGRHVMGDLLKTTFTLLRAGGFPFVILMPINAGIYLPYGFAYTYLRQAYELPLTALELGYVDKKLAVNRAEPAGAASELALVYSRALQQSNGYVLRSDLDWQNILTVLAGEKGELVEVKADGEILGYALYTKEGTALHIQELIAVTSGAKKRLLAYFKGFAGTFTELHWLAEEDDLTYLDFKEQDKAPRLQPFMMARILNVGQVLNSLPVPEKAIDTSVVFYIRDEFMVLNEVLTKLYFTSEGIQLKNTLDVPDVTMDIATLTQLYFGTYGVKELVANGKLLVKNTGLISLLQELFPRQKNFINEYF